MKEKIFICLIITATITPIYNYYFLPVIRHKELLNKMVAFEARLAKLEKK
jgi:hypothetical protein